MFYNARDKGYKEGWKEYIGVATLLDIKNWQRYENNPILRPGDKGSWDSCFVADPYLIGPIERKWHMLYYGYDGKKAYDGVAVSENLCQWEKYEGSPIISPGKEGEFDELMTHKPCVLEYNGIWYIFILPGQKIGTETALLMV